MTVSSSQARIPHRLDLVLGFVNTHELDEQRDDFATPEGVKRWLVENGLLERSAGALDEAERRLAIELREALRSLMLEHTGEAPDERAAEVLERVARDGALGVHFGSGGSAALAPGRGGFAGALAGVLVPVADASRDGSWQRVKACRADDCQWAFYDRSRNRSGVWCKMAVCGNREKVRAYRRRVPQAPRS